MLFRKERPRSTGAAEPLSAIPPSGQTAAIQGRPYAEVIAREARQQDVDEALLHAVITVESAYNPKAKSPKGAGGLMQLMPGTAARYGVTDVWDPVENIRGGARYLRDLLKMFNQNVELALAAYNAGEGAVTGSGNRIPPYAETRRYVPRVLALYDRYRAGFPL